MTLPQRESPLSSREREIITAVVNRAEGIQVTASDIWTISIDTAMAVVWVHLYNGKRLPFDFQVFKVAVAEAKAAMPETPAGVLCGSVD